MSLVPPAVQPPRVADGWRPRAAAATSWLIVACYLAAALALTWRLWADPASRAQTGDMHDVDLFAWFIRYSATAVTHGKLPALVTTAMNAPRGINLMWNTSLLAPSVLLTPVTVLAGPQASLTVLLTVGFAGSAASLYWVLRQWSASQFAAALGGAVYGFSPALVAAGTGHYHLQFAVLPPLLIHLLLRLATGRGGPVRNGAGLGLLAAVQLLTAEELLAETALAAAVMLLVMAICWPRQARDRLAGTAAGLATAAGLVAVTCGYPLWVQFHGPLAEHGSPFPAGPFRAHPATFVTPSGQLLLHTQASAAAAASYPARLPEYLAYLGWPLLVVLAAAAAGYWRVPQVRVTAVTFAVLEIFSLGGQRAWLPWHWLAHLPVLSEMLPNRFALLADGAAAALLAFGLDQARATVRDRGSAGWLSWLPAAVAVLAVLPLVPLPLPVTTAAPVPRGWQTAFTRLQLAASAPVLVVPVPYEEAPQALRWQADTGQPGSLIGGWFIGPDATGHAALYGGSTVKRAGKQLNALLAPASRVPAPSAAQVRAELAAWRPAAVVAVTQPSSRLARLLARLLGPPAVQAGQVLGWRR
ncbi:MAG TPA: hypothetical protein VMH35_21115 [Streptosporangiaceae bacterium]|nr:hypothetical protein [Streptosporangiaceae bacterium]